MIIHRQIFPLKDDKSSELQREPSGKPRAFGSARLQSIGLVIVILAMSTLFIRPSSTYFVLGVFIATPTMLLVSLWLTRFRGLYKPRPKNLIAGVCSAILLYFVFYGGNYLITTIKPLGLSASSETSIYGTISTHALPLQLAILLLDALGFESYFRGTLQNFFAFKISGQRGGRLGSVFLTALCDCLIHVISFNLLWVVTTFIADSVWGLTYYYTKDLSSSMTSHLIWDIVIFILVPIR